MLRSLALLAAIGLTLSACDSNDPEDISVDLSVQTATDVITPPTTGRDLVTGAPIAPKTYTLYSLRDNRVVLSYDTPNRADSLTTKWDIGFNGTTVIANPRSGGGIQVVSSTFAGLTEAPTSGYLNVLPASVEPTWYTYTGRATNLILPTAGRTILVRTGDGQGYAKVQVQSYYRGAPTAPVAARDEERVYTFTYVLNASGTSFVANS